MAFITWPVWPRVTRSLASTEKCTHSHFHDVEKYMDTKSANGDSHSRQKTFYLLEKLNQGQMPPDTRTPRSFSSNLYLKTLLCLE